MDVSRNIFGGMQRKAHSVQQPRHISWIDKDASTAQRGDAPAKLIDGGIL